MKEYEVGGTCRTHGDKKNALKILVNNSKRRTFKINFIVVTIKFMLQEKGVRCGLD
jgi:hypothetical protein